MTSEQEAARLATHHERQRVAKEHFEEARMKRLLNLTEIEQAEKARLNGTMRSINAGIILGRKAR